jgi:hypothetical protein
VDVGAFFAGEQHDEWIVRASAVPAVGALADWRRRKMIVDPAHDRAVFLAEKTEDFGLVGPERP